MYICLCRGITESMVKGLSGGRPVCPNELASLIGVDKDGCCGRCRNNIEAIVAFVLNEAIAS